MKLSFCCMNSVGGFLRVATVATLVLGYPVGAIAKTSQDLSQIAFLVPPKLDSLLRGTSEGMLEKGCTDILHFCRERDALVSSSETLPSPPVPKRSGGSR